MISCGSCMNFLHTALTSAGSVAVNIIVCFFFGVFKKICWTSTRMSVFSKHWSHSSRTKWATLVKLKSPSRSNANTLPGVPIKTCGQFFFSISLSSLIGVPPYTTPVLNFSKCLLNRSNSFLIWYANSRVCTTTIARTAASDVSICCRVARTKTAVFPIPDLAWHKISVPRMACGNASCCTSEGCSKPQSTMARRSSGFRRKSRKPEA
mmetsp:Transcript_28029/g.67331  ORF Transcript_28029/g.67331 Transcript_28029/m.67331 type:complete len:208 (+) Transcript_28029:607-1230(+)